MGRYSDFDDEMKGQLSIEDLYNPPERMFAVSNIFARARKEMSLVEQKTFVYALSQIDWTKSADEQSTVVNLDKKTLANILGYKADSTDISQNIWREIKHIWRNSYIDISDKDRGTYDSGTVIYRITMSKNLIRLHFSPDYFSLFTGLGNNYITMWSSDIFKMTSKRSVQFYEQLRQMSYETYSVGNNEFAYAWGVKRIKEMFDIPKEGKGSYMREKGGFDRTNFEKYVIEPICKDLMKCKMIQLVIQPDGKPYEKVKEKNRVRGYKFYWTLSQRPAVADAGEVKAITDRVDKDPQVLKVAKDIIKGEKKPKKGKKDKDKGSFFNFEQREYDHEELERRLLNQPIEEVEE